MVADDEADELMDALDVGDNDFVPPSDHFHIEMRYTAQNAAPRLAYPVLAQIKQYTDAVKATAGRVDLSIIMGPALGLTRLTAHEASRLANLTNGVGAIGVAWFSGNKNTAEWCHLIADSLGGPSVAGNSVSASYSANTMMAVIERHLNAQSQYWLEVTAYGNQLTGDPPYRDHVAERITYCIKEVLNSPNGRVLHTVDIDGRLRDFSAADATNLEAALRAAAPRRT